jgi:TctA family transporter
VLRKLECEPAPLILGFVLGPLMESNLRRAMLLSRGDFTVFLTRPISFVCILLTVLVLVTAYKQEQRRKQRKSGASQE